MQNRKRSLADEYAGEQLGNGNGSGGAKRIAISAADLLDEETLNTFKKDAIWREMQLYKQQAQQAKDLLSQAELKANRCEKVVFSIGKSWTTLNELLKGALVGLGCSDSFVDSNQLNSLIFSSINVDATDDSVDSTRSFMESSRSLINFLADTLKKNPDAMLDPKDVFKNHSVLVSDCTELKLQLESKASKEKELLQRLEDAEAQIVNQDRKIQRLQSSIVQKFYYSTAASSAEQSSSTTNLISDNTAPKELDVINVTADAKKLMAELEEWKEKYDIANSNAESRMQELQKLQKENSTLTNKLEQTVVDFQLLPEHKIAETGPFKYLESCLAHAKEDLVIVKKQNDDLRAEVEKLNSERKSFIDQVLEDENAKKAQFESEIKKLGIELTRIRNMRDSLQQKYEAIQKDHRNPEEEIENLKSLIEIYRNHIKFLNLGINRTKEKLAANTGDEEFYRHVLLTLDLNMKNKISTEDDDTDITQYRSIVDGLQEEIEKLKSEVLESVDSTAVSKQNAILIQQLNETKNQLKTIKDASGEESVAIDKLFLKIDSLKKSETMALMEMEAIADNYTQLDLKYRQTTELMSAKDDELTKLFQEKSKNEYKLVALSKEKENIGNKVIALQKSLQKQNELLKKYEESEIIRGDLIQNLEREVSQSKSLISIHEHKMREVVQLTEELNAKLEKNSSKYQELSSLLKKKEDTIEELSHLKRGAEEESRKLQTKIKHLQKRIQSNLFSSDETISNTGASNGSKELAADELENLRGWKKIAQCNVCEFRIKNHVLTKCMHVFCKECIDARLETRQRKCPQCGQAFGPGDVKPIYI